MSQATYATVEELAAALRGIAVTGKTEPLLRSALEAAAAEIDHATQWPIDAPLPTDPPDPLAHVVNLARGVEWYKANDAIFGGVGIDQIAVLRVPTDGFERHAAALIPITKAFGIA